jgi:phosphate-selective porin OprO/OprP
MTEQLGGFARVALRFGDPKLYSFHIGADVEALFEAPYDYANGSRSLVISDRPEARIDPTQIVGAVNIQNGSSSSIANVSHAQVYSVEAAGNWGPVYFQGEYFWFSVDRRPFAQPGTTFTGPTLHFNGGYVEASWVVTGQTRSYDPGAAAYSGVVPDNPFSWAKGGWGAWEIAGRYSVIDLNDRLGFVDGVPAANRRSTPLGSTGMSIAISGSCSIICTASSTSKMARPVPSSIRARGSTLSRCALRSRSDRQRIRPSPRRTRGPNRLTAIMNFAS